MAGGRAILEKFGRLPVGEVLGVRAPLLRLGGNNMFAVSFYLKAKLFYNFVRTSETDSSFR